MNTPEPFGDYILLERVAIGGMAEIFRARKQNDPAQRDLCIKRILPHYSEDESFINMFIDEARIAAQLQHPNIVQIYDFDTHDDSYYIAMELVTGRDLKQTLETCVQHNTQLTPEMVAVIAAALARSLHYAHTKEVNGQPLNIVHRDVSPHNVLLGFNGEVKLTDFGIAKAASRITTTRAGTVKGKCAYMSPEQARGKTLDGRSDIFSIGILMYETLANRRLFTGDSDFDILTKVLKEEIVPPSEYRAGLDPELERICMKALERDRNLRYSSGAALERDLQQWINHNLGGDESRAGIGDFMSVLFGLKQGALPAPGAAAVPQDIAAVAEMKTAMFDRSTMGDPLGAAPDPMANPDLEPRMVVPAPGGDAGMVFHDEKTAISQSPLLQHHDEPATLDGGQDSVARTEAIDYADVMASMEQRHQQEMHAQAARAPSTPQPAPPRRQPRAAAPPPEKKTPWGLIAVALAVFGLFTLTLLGGAGYYLYAHTDLLGDQPAVASNTGNTDADKNGDGEDGEDKALAANTQEADAGQAPPQEEDAAEPQADAGEAQPDAMAQAADADAGGEGEGDAGAAEADAGDEATAEVDAGAAEDDAGEDAPALASLVLNTDPPGATLYLNDEKQKGVTPLTLKELPQGEELALRVEKKGYEPLEEKLTLEKAEDRRILSLKKSSEDDKQAQQETLSPEERRKRAEERRKRLEEARQKQGSGTLTINAFPWANVKLDGRNVGRTPVTRQVSAGRHVVILSNPDKNGRTSKAVTVKKDEKKTVFHRFK